MRLQTNWASSISVLSLSLLCWTAVISAQPVTGTQQFDNQEDWECAMCNTVVTEDFSGLTNPDFDTLSFPFTTGVGVFELVNGSTGVGFGVLNDGVDKGLRISEVNAADPVSGVLWNTGTLVINGDLEGVGIVYQGDGLDLIVSRPGLPIEIINVPGSATPTFWGYRNSTDPAHAEVADFEISTFGDFNGPDGIVDSLLVYSVSVALGTPCEDGPDCDDPTDRDELNSAIDNLQALLPTGSSVTDSYIELGILYLEEASNDLFWLEDGRLSDYGLYALRYIDSGSYCIELIQGDEMVDAVVDQLQSLTNSIVDTEIQYAIDNGGDAGLIDAALYFDAVAEHFSGFGYYGRSFRFWRRAWYYARLSTL